MKDVIELPDYPPYAVDDKLNIYNLNTERKLKKDEDGNVKIKKNGKTVTLNVDKYCKEHDFYNFDENLINNNIIYNEPSWMIEDVITKERYKSIDEVVKKYKINRRALVLHLKGLYKFHTLKFRLNEQVDKIAE